MSTTEQVYTYYDRNQTHEAAHFKFCPYCQTELTLNLKMITSARPSRRPKKKPAWMWKSRQSSMCSLLYYSPKYHFLVIYVIAHVIGGEMQAGDDMVEVDWFPLWGPLPELAFIEDVDTLKVLAEGNFKALPISVDQLTPKSQE